MNEDEEAGYWTWRAVQKQAESMRIPYVTERPARSVWLCLVVGASVLSARTGRTEKAVT